MSGRLLVSAAIFALCITLLGGCYDGADGHATPAATPTITTLEAHIRFRQKFGLRADEAYVRSVDADPASSLEFSIPMTTTEVAELRARDASLNGVVGPPNEDLSTDSSFGGLYIDQSSGGTIVVLTTGDESAIRNRASRFLAPGQALETRHVQYTYAELGALQDRVSADFDQWKARGVQFAGVGVDIIANRLQITVVGLTPDVARQLTDGYGPRVAVVDGEAPQAAPIGRG